MPRGLGLLCLLCPCWAIRDDSHLLEDVQKVGDFLSEVDEKLAEISQPAGHPRTSDAFNKLAKQVRGKGLVNWARGAVAKSASSSLWKPVIEQEPEKGFRLFEELVTSDKVGVRTAAAESPAWEALMRKMEAKRIFGLFHKLLLDSKRPVRIAAFASSMWRLFLSDSEARFREGLKLFESLLLDWQWFMFKSLHSPGFGVLLEATSQDTVGPVIATLRKLLEMNQKAMLGMGRTQETIRDTCNLIMDGLGEHLGDHLMTWQDLAVFDLAVFVDSSTKEGGCSEDGLWERKIVKQIRKALGKLKDVEALDSLARSRLWVNAVQPRMIQLIREEKNKAVEEMKKARQEKQTADLEKEKAKNEKIKADKAREDAEKHRKEAVEANSKIIQEKEAADKAREQAEAEKDRAEKEKQRAEDEKIKADKAREDAEKHRKEAVEANSKIIQEKEAANKAREQAEAEKDRAEKEKQRAEDEKIKADEAREDAEKHRKKAVEANSKIIQEKEAAEKARKQAVAEKDRAEKEKQRAENEKRAADEAKENAEKHRKEAVYAKDKIIQEKERAESERHAADQAKEEALHAKKKADKAKQEADVQRKKVEAANVEILQQKDMAENQKKRAQHERNAAVKARKQAERHRNTAKLQKDLAQKSKEIAQKSEEVTTVVVLLLVLVLLVALLATLLAVLWWRYPYICQWLAEKLLVNEAKQMIKKAEIYEIALSKTSEAPANMSLFQEYKEVFANPYILHKYKLLEPVLCHAFRISNDALQKGLCDWDFTDIEKNTTGSKQLLAAKNYQFARDFIYDEEPDNLPRLISAGDDMEKLKVDYSSELEKLEDRRLMFVKMYEQAFDAKRAFFDPMIQRIAKETKTEAHLCAEKGMMRLAEKFCLRPASGLIWDCVRAMLVGHTLNELIEVLQMLKAEEAAKQIKIVGVNNRFKKPTSDNWQDLAIYIMFTDPQFDGIVAEIQLTHETFLAVRTHFKAHDAYEHMRFAAEVFKLKNKVAKPGLPDSQRIETSNEASIDKGVGGGGDPTATD